jgi:hypothetical protein
VIGLRAAQTSQGKEEDGEALDLDLHGSLSAAGSGSV